MITLNTDSKSNELTTAQAAEILGVKPETIRRYRVDERLKATLTWRGLRPVYMFDRADVEAFKQMLGKSRG